MLRFQKKQKIIKEIITKICDKCGRIVSEQGNQAFEFQEFYHFRFIGGFNSAFGDLSEIECDICQHCLYDLIKNYYRTNKSSLQKGKK